MFKIYISAANGLSFTGITCRTEQEAKELCKKYNEQDDNPYCQHIYRRV